MRAFWSRLIDIRHLPQAPDITLRWSPEKPAVLPAELRRALVEATERQAVGRPAKLARALLTIASQEPPPRRFIAGADAIDGAEQKLVDLKAEIESNRELSTSLAFDRRFDVPTGYRGSHLER